MCGMSYYPDQLLSDNDSNSNGNNHLALWRTWCYGIWTRSWWNNRYATTNLVLEFLLIWSQALWHTLRDAAAGIKWPETQQLVSSVPFSGKIFLTWFTHLDQSKSPFCAGPNKQTMSKGAVPASPWHYHGPTSVNPEILGDPPEADFCNEDGENMKADPHFTGCCSPMLKNSPCDPEVIKETEFEEWAIWLGKWFVHHYAAWVLKFDMKELETSKNNEEWKCDLVVGLVEALHWTLCHFLIPENKWQMSEIRSFLPIFSLWTLSSHKHSSLSYMFSPSSCF